MLKTNKKLRRWLKITLVISITALFVSTVAFFLWATIIPSPLASSIDALRSNELVEVEVGEWLIFRPKIPQREIGVIFYPGARVDYRAYSSPMKLIAEQGYLVVVPRMPLNMALFAPNRALEIESKFPEVKRWVVAGHSMGGAFAAQYAAKRPETVVGLMLWAAYPAGSGTLSNSNISVLSIFGSRDEVATPNEVLNGRKSLPSRTEFREIVGGNHAQFGSYGPQSGDGEATISREEQQNATVKWSLEFLDGFTN